MSHDSHAFTTGIEDVDTAGTAAIDIAYRVHFHAVWYALSSVRRHIGKWPCGCQGEGAVVLHFEGAHDALTRVVDVKDALIGREGQAVRHDEIAHRQSQSAQVGGTPEMVCSLGRRKVHGSVK